MKLREGLIALARILLLLAILVLGVVSRSETPPNEQSFAVYDELSAQINAQLQKLSQIMKTDVPAFNQLVKDQNIPAIVVRPSTGGGGQSPPM